MNEKEALNDWITTEEAIVIAELVHRYGVEAVAEACEKQIPKKPIITEESKKYDAELCPICNAIVRNGEYAENFCNGCGQRIDFEEGDTDESK